MSKGNMLGLIAIFLTLLFFSLCFTVGWLLATLLNQKANLEKVGVSTLLGFWWVTLIMMVAYQLIGQFSRELTLILSAGSALALFLIMGKNRRNQVKQELRYMLTHSRQIFTGYTKVGEKLNRLEKLLLGIVAVILGQTTWSNLTWPVADWDAIALYDFRAILMEQVGHWLDGKKLGYFYQYPPFTSLLHGGVYLMGLDQVKIVYTALFFGFLLLFYAFIRQLASRSQAIVGIFLLSISPLLSDHITVAYTNMPYAIYFSAGVLFTWRWLTQKNVSDMQLAFIFTAAACWIRASEPFWVIVFGLLLAGRLFVVRNVPWKTVLVYSILFLGLVRYWPEYVNTLELPPPPAVAAQARIIDEINPTTIAEHAVSVTIYLINNAVEPLFLLLLPTTLVFLFDKQFRRTPLFKASAVTLILLAGSIVAGTYFFSFTYNTWDAIGPSLTRMMMSLVPLLIYIVSISNFWPTIFQHLVFAKTRARKPKEY